MRQLTTQSEEQAQQAWRAVRHFRTLLPSFQSFARTFTGDDRIIVKMGVGQGSFSTSREITITPPLAFGADIPHQRSVCERRDPFTRVMQCPACASNDDLMWRVFHEIAHIGFDSFQPFTYWQVKDIANTVHSAWKDQWPKFAKAKAEKIRVFGSAKSNQVFGQLCHEIHPYLRHLVNVIEDARIDKMMTTARVGIRSTMEAFHYKTLNEGCSPELGGKSEHVAWNSVELDGQILILFYYTSVNIDPTGFLSDTVLALLQDERVKALADDARISTSVHESTAISIELLARLHELGHLNPPPDESEPPPPPPQPSPPTNDENAEDQKKDDDQQSTESEPGSDDTGDASDDGGDPSDTSGEPDSSDDDSSDPGQDEQDHADADGPEPEGQSVSDDDDGEDADDEDSEDSSGPTGDTGEAEASDSQSDSSTDDEGSDDGDPAGEDAEGDADQPESDREDPVEDNDGGGPGEGGPGQDDNSPDGASDSGADRDEEDGDAVGGDSEAGSGSTDGVPGTDDGDTLDDPDPGPDPRDEDLESQPDGGTASDPEVVDEIMKVLDVLVGHGDITAEEKEAIAPELAGLIEKAIQQSIYFEGPSLQIAGVSIHQHGTAREGIFFRDSAKTILWDRIQVPEKLLGPALMRMRIAFAENKAAKNQGNLKSGRINAKVLGRRAPTQDPRLFNKKTRPGKRDYHVVIGLDASGSTEGKRIYWIKEAALALAELCHRTGVSFEIWAHTGGYGVAGDSLDNVKLDMIQLKLANEPWDWAAKYRLALYQPGGVNLDGHAMEFLRKQAEKSRASDRILMYFSDGDMPAWNYDEELFILQNEIVTCRQKGIILGGVGVQTDSPARHGLETVRVNGPADIVHVVAFLEKKLSMRV